MLRDGKIYVQERVGAHASRTDASNAHLCPSPSAVVHSRIIFPTCLLFNRIKSRISINLNYILFPKFTTFIDSLNGRNVLKDEVNLKKKLSTGKPVPQQIVPFIDVVHTPYESFQYIFATSLSRDQFTHSAITTHRSRDKKKIK